MIGDSKNDLVSCAQAWQRVTVSDDVERFGATLCKNDIVRWRCVDKLRCFLPGVFYKER